MTLLIVHLSDIHIADAQDNILARVENVARAIFPQLSDATAIFIAVSGDVANEGLKSHYDLASTFFQELRSYISKQTPAPVHFVFAPGNHDCNFSGNQNLRNAVLKGLDGNSVTDVDATVVETCTRVQTEFMAFRDALVTTSARKYGDQLFESFEFDVGGYKVAFDCFNVSWLSQKREIAGKIQFPFAKYEPQFLTPISLRIAVFHHPFNWYAPGEHRDFFDFVKRYSNIVLTGHEHELSASRVIDVGAADRDTVFVGGGVLQDRSGQRESSFNVITIDLEKSTHQVLPYSWSSASDSIVGDYATEDESREFSPLHTIQKRAQLDFRISDLFRAQLVDAGAVFNHPNKEGSVSIEDVFVYPDVRFVERNDEESERVSARAFENVSDKNTYVLIKGEEKCGKTTLGYRLFRSFHHIGLVPVYVDAIDVDRAGSKDLKKALSRTINREYGDGSADRFFRTDIARRVLLLDNFELIPVGERYRHKVLEFFHREFPHIFIFSNDVVQLDELFLPEATKLLQLYRSAEILRFGHKLRYDLINKWNSIGENPGLASGDILARNGQAEKMVNGIIGKNFVPSLPIFLLTILQSIEAGKPSAIQQNGWGHYYQFLIVQALRSVNVKEKELGELFNYMGGLAFRFFSLKKKELSEQEMREFNDWFSREYTLIDFKKREELLLKTKILVRHGAAYEFVYPYIYYYFVAQYLAAHIREPEIRDAVKGLCSRAYVLEFANIVIFLAHHSNDPLVIDELVALSRKLFANLAPVRFETDIADINKSITEIPQLVYRASDPSENRRSAAELKDGLVEPDEMLEKARPEVELEALSLPSQINLAFKTAEILGQIVRSNYGSMKKRAKVEVLADVYDAPLRALRKLFTEIAGDPTELIEWIDHWLKEERPAATDEQRQELAQRWFFAVLAALGANFVKKISDAVGSENLREEYELLLKENPSLSYRLITLSTKLDIPKSLPFAEVKQLAQDLEGNALAFRVLQSLVLKHLHMFKTTDIDKQKLCDSVKIQMGRQRSIDVKTKSTKLLSRKP